MYAFAALGEVKKRTLALGDKLSIALAYPLGPNTAPTADAGPDQGVSTSSFVTLDGSDSSDPEGNPLTFSWTQTDGTGVMLNDVIPPAHRGCRRYGRIRSSLTSESGPVGASRGPPDRSVVVA